jgi:hypothetical protein
MPFKCVVSRSDIIGLDGHLLQMQVIIGPTAGLLRNAKGRELIFPSDGSG